MPVIPPGIAPYSIQPPLTTGDKGTPTDRILRDAKRVFDLIEDERHLTAMELYKTVKERIDAWDRARKRKSSNTSNRGGGGGNNKNKVKGFLGGGGRGKNIAKLEAASTPEDMEYSDAKAFLQARHPQIIKLQV